MYRDTTIYLLRKEPRVADILSHVQHTENPSPDDGWPSWVPDWPRPRDTSCFGTIGVFRADRQRLRLREISSYPDQVNRLYIEGYTLDRVSIVTDTIEANKGEDLGLEVLWYQLFDEPIETALQGTYFGADSPLAVYLVTLIMGEMGFLLYDGSTTAALQSIEQREDYQARFIQAQERVLKDAFAFLLKTLEPDTSDTVEGLDVLREVSRGGNAEHYHKVAKGNSSGRKLFLTGEGRLGLGPRVTQPGDLLTVVFGGKTPFVLRSVEDHFLFIGDSYVRDVDIMFGEMSDAVRAGKGPFERQTSEIH